MTSLSVDLNAPNIKRVNSFQELLNTPFAEGVNAVCWPRVLEGDFAGVVASLGDGGGEAITVLDESRMRDLPLSTAGRVAAEVMLADLRMLRAHELDPVLNCIHGYPRDDEAGPVATDVFSYHADSAPVATATWLCTYHGPSSEGLANEEALRRVDMPDTRAELWRLFGGTDEAEFREFLNEHCYDLHYAPVQGARPYSLGVGNLWRIAVDYPGCPVPPCIHRAPNTQPGQPARLLLIS
ncbi:hypothetical protein IMCC26134_07295 [Verrucomicrobia bacterium IMCC26134]|nr:hypothetical protein IMCC26134_07295 [Verrucomicrobia bacterium IMCC26134]